MRTAAVVLGLLLPEGRRHTSEVGKRIVFISLLPHISTGIIRQDTVGFRNTRGKVIEGRGIGDSR